MSGPALLARRGGGPSPWDGITPSPHRPLGIKAKVEGYLIVGWGFSGPLCLRQDLEGLLNFHHRPRADCGLQCEWAKLNPGWPDPLTQNHLHLPINTSPFSDPNFAAQGLSFSGEHHIHLQQASNPQTWQCICMCQRKGLKYSFSHIIYFWLLCVFVVTHWLSLVAVGGGCSSLQAMGLLQWLLL